MASEHHELDENLYSRQLYVLGYDATKRMQHSNVLIVGLTGLGVEIAKNVILMGVKSVTLYDDQLVQWSDLSSQFYCSEDSIHQKLTRSDASLPHLKELNHYVAVSVYHGELSNQLLSSFNVVVFVNQPIAQLVDKNEFCRANNIKFIASESRGLFGSVFCDFGDGFVINDEDGENPVVNIVTNITNSNPGVVSVHDEEPVHGLRDDDFVVFEEVKGMDELNWGMPVQIKSTGKHTFTIGDTTHLPPYVGGGYVKQVKPHKTVNYQSLATQLEQPTIIDYDLSKVGRPLQLHAFSLALSDFYTQNNELPRSYNEVDAQQLYHLAQKHFAKLCPDNASSLDEKMIKLLANGSRGNLSPMAALLGGIAAQEVQKATSGKFTPLNQWLYFETLECVPDYAIPTEADTQPQSNRYDGQVAVFGRTFQDKLFKFNNFVVGSGALGCEYLKNFAMMGIACGGGQVTITDMSNIEMSNLNRQFLFRRHHIGKQKSIVAAEAAREMNKSFNVIAMQHKVVLETEEVFDDAFWESFTTVTNALDNVQARLYVDSRCVYYRKPLLEAGTSGTKANVQVVIPHLTESYVSTRDPGNTTLSFTSKNSTFPFFIEHCIQWSKNVFEGMFNKAPFDANDYLSKPTFIDETGVSNRGIVESIYESLVLSKPQNFEDCIVWARKKFEQLFNNSIHQLLHAFPLDQVTSSGTRFWSGPKRPPRPLKFDTRNDAHLDFIVAAANLRAYVYGLTGHRAGDFDFQGVLSRADALKSSPKSVEVKDRQAVQHSNLDEDDIVAQLISKLPKPSDLAGFRLNVVEFEKDDDTNFHIDFITAASNLRGDNFKIHPADRHKTKGIAGKIIPAMVTTTAAVTGIASFELYKFVQEVNRLSAHKNAFINMALPSVTLNEPGEPEKLKYGENEWSLWDRFEVDEGRDITLKEFLELFKQKHRLEVTFMSAGSGLIYASFYPPSRIGQRMSRKVSELIRTCSKINFTPKQKHVSIELCCTNADTDEDVDVPCVRYKFK